MPEQQQAPDEERYRKELSRRVKAMQLEQQKRELAQKLLENAAYERLMNVRISSPELYSQLISIIIQMAQSNRIQGKLTEEQLKSLLAKLTYKPESRIEFRHK